MRRLAIVIPIYITIKIDKTMLENLKDKATDLMNNENVKEVVEKVTEFTKSEKGKEVIETVKEKTETFFKDKFGK